MPDCVFLTGATGFVGSHVLRALLRRAYRVVALVRPGSAIDAGEGTVDVVEGDLSAVGDVARALRGCRYLVHCAARYSFAPRDRASMHRVNVEATASLLLAAHLAGVERAVVTSSSATLGPARGDRPANESDYADQQSGSHADADADPYHRSKIEQERAALAARVPAIALLPTAPVGPRDAKPTPTGKLVLDFARGNIGAKAPGRGGMNLVAVEDVARAHVAALTRGTPGERYVVGGENLSMDRIWEALSEVTGVAMPRWRVPYALALAAARADGLRCRLDPSATPRIPLEGVRMSRERMYADSSKARAELGHEPTPVGDALERAVSWYRRAGYVR